MATDPILRPAFYEGQVLGAADLATTLDYPRNQLARHERFLHSWGIAAGLELTQPIAGGAIFVGPGVAIDGTGREIVVPVRESLPEANFSSVLQGPKFYPVFLVGKDKSAPAATTLSGLCNDTQPSRVLEGYEYEFGRPGDELALDEQTRPDIADGPGGDPTSGRVWRILLGFVGAKNQKPDGPRDTSPDTLVSRRYAGVRADDVAARGPALALHTSDGAAGKPALRIDETDGASLMFGLQGAAPVFTVNAKGDLTITGKFGTGTPKGSAILVQSGVASDGVILPLPSGVTRAMVDAGQVTLHVQVTQRPGNEAAPTPAPHVWGSFPLECFVDETFRVHCAVRWHYLTGGTAPTDTVVDAPAACQYTVLAVFPPETR